MRHVVGDQVVLPVTDKNKGRHADVLDNAPSDWVIAETLAYFDVSESLSEAVKKWVAAHGSDSKGNIKANLQTLASGGVLEKRNAERAMEWVATLNN